MRIVDPELPQSRLADGSASRSRPSISTVPAPVAAPSGPRRTTHPSWRKQLRVLAQSAPVEKFASRVVPSASDAIIA